jgi:hypothetical protein
VRASAFLGQGNERKQEVYFLGYVMQPTFSRGFSMQHYLFCLVSGRECVAPSLSVVRDQKDWF